MQWRRVKQRQVASGLKWRVGCGVVCCGVVWSGELRHGVVVYTDS